MENKLRASKAAVICYGFGDLASQKDADDIRERLIARHAAEENR